jgi:uncharacterized protein YecE (DUF72 family)
MSACGIENKKAAKLWNEMAEVEQYELASSTPAVAARLINNTNPTVNGKSVEVLSVVPYGDSFNVTYREKGVKNTFEVEVNDPLDRKLTTASTRALFSDLDSIKDLKENSEKVEVDLLNNPDKMLSLGEELAKMGNVAIGESHKNLLLGRLVDIKDNFKDMMPEISLHINKSADKNGGIAELSSNFESSIYIGTGPGHSFKNPLEVYLHELYHSLTYYALESRDPQLSNVVRDIQQIKNEFLENTTAHKLSYALGRGKGSVKEAQKILDYFADESVGLHEFVAYAMSNEAIMKVLSSSTSKREKADGNLFIRLVAGIKNMLSTLVDKVRKKPTGNDLQKMMWLVNEVAKANNRALTNKKEGLLARVITEYGNTQEKLKDWIASSEAASKLVNNTPKQSKNTKLSRAAYLGKLLASAFFNEKSKRALETSASLIGLKFLKPEATLQTFIRDASESDNFQDLIEHEGLKSSVIDQDRENIAIHTSSSIVNGFDSPLSEKDDIALTTVLLDTDAVTVYYDYDMEALLSDERYADTEINKLKEKLKELSKDEETYRYYEAQIKGLSHYMRKGTVTSVQLLNAENIAKQLGTKYEITNPSKELMSVIDKLASLDAIRNTDKESKIKVANLIKEDKEGVDTLVAYVDGHKEHSEKTLFSSSTDKMKIIKGYTKEIFSRDIEGQVAPLADKLEMKKKGFKLHKVLGSHRAHDNVEMAYYVSTTNVQQNLHRVAIRYTDTTSKGTTFRESYRNAGDRLVNLKAEKSVLAVNAINVELVDKLRRGEETIESLSKKEKANVVALLDNNGKAKDYRYMMTKKEKEELFGQDRRASAVIGRTFASTYDKKESKSFNEKLIELVVKDAEENMKGTKGKVGRNTKEYVLIEENSTEEEAKDLWKVVPKHIKAKHPNGILVRRDMMHSVFGYRELSVMDAGIVKHFPEGMKRAIAVAEKLWKEIVKIAKVDIILRVPEVFIGNVVSNFMYSILTGSSPITIAKLQMQGVLELKKYIADKSKLTILEQKQIAGKTSKEEDRIITALRNDVEMSSVAPLVDAGFYTTIVEELELGIGKNSSKITDMADDKFKNVPEVIRNGADWLYLNEKTSFFKMMNTATQYSDFVARYAQYHILQKRGVDKESAIKTVRDAFINYNKPNSRFVEWANQMGFIMFTKYFSRIQKAIKQLFKGHPISAVLALSAQEFLVGDIEDITDQSILTKDITNSFYNPLETFMRAITPSGAEAIAYGMKAVV